MKINFELMTEFLKRQRFEQKKVQSDIAKEIGVSVTTYRNYENNPKTIDLETGIKINQALNCNIFEFFLDSMLQNATKHQE